jgi:hypothetical protein
MSPWSIPTFNLIFSRAGGLKLIQVTHETRISHFLFPWMQITQNVRNVQCFLWHIRSELFI